MILCSTVITSIYLFLVTCLYMGYLLINSSCLLSLLFILVYLGALLVLFAYIWIYIPSFSLEHSLFWYFPVVVLAFGVNPSLSSSSLTGFCHPSSFVLFLAILLFWTIVVVVHILDLSLGGFSS